MINGILGWILSGVTAYCLGSISVGILVSKAANGPDLRTVGSKNTGASNVQRTMGWKYGLIVFFGDFLKAVAACAIGRWLTGQHLGALFGGLMAIIGHNWPVFFQFRGGKGVASSCGVMLFCFWQPALIAYAIAIALIALTRYISLGSMTLLISYGLMVSVFFSGGNIPTILWCVILAVLCVWRHHANIGRLIRGEENKLGQKVKPSDDKKGVHNA